MTLEELEQKMLMLLSEQEKHFTALLEQQEKMQASMFLAYLDIASILEALLESTLETGIITEDTFKAKLSQKKSNSMSLLQEMQGPDGPSA